MKTRILLALIVALAFTIPRPAQASATSTPSWKILALIYDKTDFTFADASGVNRHVVAEMTPDEKTRAASSANAFVYQDIPDLTSHEMIPSLKVRYPGTLTDLDPFGGWWPSPRVTASDLDPAFDSVIVIWDSSGTDLNSGESYNLQNYGGLTVPEGIGQTYSTFQIDSVPANSRNVFKHEWGHAILSYFDATGAAPKPAVDNHQPQSYVNCKTQQPYVLVDETTDNTIRNSIYNDKAGFTHDYYSGMTALAGSRTCLGITRLAWATGGPVSRP